MQIFLHDGRRSLALSGGAWQIIWVTLRLARTLPPARCDDLEMGAGVLSLGELRRVATHLEEILAETLRPGEFLMRDLTLTDLPPMLAFPLGDPRREIFLDWESLSALQSFFASARDAVTVERVHLSKGERKEG